MVVCTPQRGYHGLVPAGRCAILDECTNGELKNKGCWACSSNNFEGPKVFVCELARRPCCPDKFCTQESLVTDLQQGCGRPRGIHGGLRALLCDCKIFTEASVDVGEVGD